MVLEQKAPTFSLSVLMSRLQRFSFIAPNEPGALPQAITFRALGADKLYFSAPASKTKNTWRRFHEACHTCVGNFRDLSRQWL